MVSGLNVSGVRFEVGPKPGTSCVTEMSHSTVSSHGPGKVAGSFVGHPSAGTPHTRVPSFGFGSAGSSKPSAGQFCVCPAGQAVNTPQISPGRHSAFDEQCAVGDRADFSAHAPSAKSSNTGQMLVAGGASTGGWQAAAHSGELLPKLAHAALQSLIRWWTWASVRPPNSSASVVVQTNGPNLGQGKPRTLQAGSGTGVVVMVPSLDGSHT